MPPANRQPLSGPEIQTLIATVAERLAGDGPQHTLIIVGGSLLAWRGFRASTEDVDSIVRLEAELRAAVEIVAAEHDLAMDWLNAQAAQFKPQTFQLEECDILLEHPRLLVLGAPLRQVFIMKMYRADPPDQDDMVTMWPHIGFATAHEAVSLFYEAYPHLEEDPHLDEFVITIARRAGYDVS